MDEILMVERLCGHISKIQFEEGVTDEEKLEIIYGEIKATICEWCSDRLARA